MDAVKVFEEIQQAVHTLRLLPPADWPSSKTGYWPDVIQNFYDAYGYTAPTVRVIPTARQISRLDEVIEWMSWLPPEYARIIWARAEGFSWRQIARATPNKAAPNTCRNHFRIGVCSIAHRLSKETA